jgi:hypothetical protein
MRFYGNGVVWDAENEKRLCRFSRTERGKKGVLDTDDPRICAELIRLGYEHEPFATGGIVSNEVVATAISAPVDTVLPVTADMNAKKLREIGRGLGLKFPVGVTKVDMAKAINEAKK